MEGTERKNICNFVSNDLLIASSHSLPELGEFNGACVRERQMHLNSISHCGLQEGSGKIIVWSEEQSTKFYNKYSSDENSLLKSSKT